MFPAPGLRRYGGRIYQFHTEFCWVYLRRKNGNIWTGSQRSKDRRWLLTRYDEKSLSKKKTTVTEIASEHEDNQGMIFGILEAYDGGLDGVYRYDGNTIQRIYLDFIDLQNTKTNIC